jgi:hypothetical protein
VVLDEIHDFNEENIVFSNNKDFQKHHKSNRGVAEFETRAEAIAYAKKWMDKLSKGAK